MNIYGKLILGYGISSGVYRGKVNIEEYPCNENLYVVKFFRNTSTVVGSIILNTILFPISISNNMARLEVNIRNLEEEKKKPWYKDIL